MYKKLLIGLLLVVALYSNSEKYHNCVNPFGTEFVSPSSTVRLYHTVLYWTSDEDKEKQHHLQEAEQRIESIKEKGLITSEWFNTVFMTPWRPLKVTSDFVQIEVDKNDESLTVYNTYGRIFNKIFNNEYESSGVSLKDYMEKVKKASRMQKECPAGYRVVFNAKTAEPYYEVLERVDREYLNTPCFKYFPEITFEKCIPVEKLIFRDGQSGLEYKMNFWSLLKLHFLKKGSKICFDKCDNFSE